MHEKITAKFLVPQFLSIKIRILKDAIKAKNHTRGRMTRQVTKDIKIAVHIYVD